jgi:hypothetical protein
MEGGDQVMGLASLSSSCGLSVPVATVAWPVAKF